MDTLLASIGLMYGQYSMCVGSFTSIHHKHNVNLGLLVQDKGQEAFLWSGRNYLESVCGPLCLRKWGLALTARHVDGRV